MSRARIVVFWVSTLLFLSCNGNGSATAGSSTLVSADPQLVAAVRPLVSYARYRPTGYIGLVQITNISPAENVTLSTRSVIQGVAKTVVGGTFADFQVLRTYMGAPPRRFIEITCGATVDSAGNIISGQATGCPRASTWIGVGNIGDLLVVFADPSTDPAFLDGASEIRRLIVKGSAAAADQPVDLSALDVADASLSRVELAINAALAEPVTTVNGGTGDAGVSSRDGG